MDDSWNEIKYNYRKENLSQQINSQNLLLICILFPTQTTPVPFRSATRLWLHHTFPIIIYIDVLCIENRIENSQKQKEVSKLFVSFGATVNRWPHLLKFNYFRTEKNRTTQIKPLVYRTGYISGLYKRAIVSNIYDSPFEVWFLHGNWFWVSAQTQC